LDRGPAVRRNGDRVLPESLDRRSGLHPGRIPDLVRDRGLNPIGAKPHADDQPQPSKASAAEYLPRQRRIVEILHDLRIGCHRTHLLTSLVSLSRAQPRTTGPPVALELLVGEVSLFEPVPEVLDELLPLPWRPVDDREE